MSIIFIVSPVIKLNPFVIYPLANPDLPKGLREKNRRKNHPKSPAGLYREKNAI